MQAPIVQTLAHPQSLVEDLVDVFFTYSSGCSNKLDPLSHQKGKRHSCTLFWTVPNGCTPNSRAARPALISPKRSNSITKASCALHWAWTMCSSDTPVTATVNLTSISGSVIPFTYLNIGVIVGKCWLALTLNETIDLSISHHR